MRRFVSAVLVLTLVAFVARDAGAGSDDGGAGGAAAAALDLVVDLGSSEAHVREQARDALVKLGAAAVPALVGTLEGPNARARVEAARTLARIGVPAADALPALKKAATSADADLAAAARDAVAAVESRGPRLADLLVDLKSAAAPARVAATRRLPLVGDAELADAAMQLAALATDRDESVRLAAVESMAALGPEALVAAKREDDASTYRLRLAGALGDDSRRVRAAGVHTAIVLAKSARVDAHLMLLEVEQKDDRRTRPWMLAAVAESADASTARQLNGASLAATVQAMQRADLDAIGAALAETLGAVRPVTPDALQALAGATGPGPSARIRRRAALALGSLADSIDDRGVDALIALLADRESRSQVEAATALRQVLAATGERAWKPSRAPADVQQAIDAGLDWLAAHQDEDGNWDGVGFEKHDPQGDRSGGAGKATFDEGLTALAALALARSGAVPSFRDADGHGTALRRALVKLVAIQDADGCYGARGIKHWIYTQAIGTLAMVEAARRTGSPLWVDSAQRALDFLAACRNPEGSWRYDVRPADADTSVNGWVVQAMRAGERAGLRVDRAGYAQVLRYLGTATDPATGAVGYLPNGRESARTNDMLKKFPPALTTAMTSSSCVQRFLLGRDPRTDPLLAKGLDVVRKMPPVWDAAGGRTDLYSWMAGTEALSYAGGDGWTAWKKALREALLPAQCAAKSGARAGSWDPDDPWGPDGGRVYSTAAAVLCLETHQGQVPPLPRDPTNDGRGLRVVRALDAAAKDTSNHETVRDAARAALAGYGKQ